MKPKVQRCCICDRAFKGFGNNPWPVKEYGVCCDDCNATYVIPARLANILVRKEKNENA